MNLNREKEPSKKCSKYHKWQLASYKWHLASFGLEKQKGASTWRLVDLRSFTKRKWEEPPSWTPPGESKKARDIAILTNCRRKLRHVANHTLALQCKRWHLCYLKTPQSINLINLTKLNVKSTPHKKARYLTTDCDGKCCRPYLALQCKCNGLQMARDTKTPIFFGRVEFVCF